MFDSSTPSTTTENRLQPEPTRSYQGSFTKPATALGANNTCSHDANGNQTQRIIGIDTYNLTYDAEGRLSNNDGDTLTDNDAAQVHATATF